MRYILISILFFVAFCSMAVAQESEIQQDTTIVKPPVLDSALFKKDVFSLLKERGPFSNRVSIDQTENVLTAFNNHIALSANKIITGFRVRIFFDNKQDARVHSNNLAGSFAGRFPDIPVYWTYKKPYFKVTVGDFRTKSEAMVLFKRIEAEYPSAFIVRETINFPPL